jgi:hypothetical protein
MDMKKIKLSPFWLGIVAALALLLFVLAPMVGTMMTKQARLQRDVGREAQNLAAARAGTPSRGDIESWQKYKGEVGTAYKSVTDFYTGSDKYLERWFPNILVGADGDPSRDTFMARYSDEGRLLEEKLSKAPHNVVIGLESDREGGKTRFGFNWEAVTPGDWATITAQGAGDEKHVLRELQKRFWARQRLANIILNSSVKVNRIVDFRFFKPLHERMTQAPWQQFPQKPSEAIHWMGVNAGTNGQPIGFSKTVLPNDLGTTLTFGFALELPYSEVPKAIREMLNPGNEAAAQERMLVNLIGTLVTIREQNEPVIAFNYIQGDDADKAAKMADALKKAGGDKPRSVLLAVTCQIIDFDPGKVKKFDSKASN